MLEAIIARTENYLKTISKQKQKTVGQFFTNIKTARFMAEMLNVPQKKELVLLDPGAGSGILSAAFLERLEQSAWQGEKVHLICYENDEIVLPLLKENLADVKEKVHFSLEIDIREKNYITSQYNAESFADIVIGNPPYLKINRQSLEAVSMPYVVHGAPNLYFLFAAKSIENLVTNGEMVYIMPRSWTSGAYFQAFRKFLFSNVSVLQMHLFVSRDKVFSKVLQETMILHVKKSQKQQEKILITSSETADFTRVQSFTAEANVIVTQNDSRYVFLVGNAQEEQVLQKMQQFHHTLLDYGFRMKTGLTVDFREREFLTVNREDESIPLFYAQHLKNGRICFPSGSIEEWLKSTAKNSLRQRNENYLFFKRFTAKEEKRRLQCSIYLAADFQNYEEISTHNKLDFITGIKKPLSLVEVYGLYVLFNSTLYDQYYRILNGSTQVNATEVNAMPMPEYDVIIACGRELLQAKDLTTQTCDEILARYLYEQNGRSKKVFASNRDAGEAADGFVLPGIADTSKYQRI